MPCKPLWKLNGLFCVLLITACSYSVSLNDRVIYTPPGLFKDYQISDSHLANCIEQHLLDQNISKAHDLKQVDCSHAGIVSLAGIETFTGIEALNLANNQLRDLQPLSQLAHLRLLILRQNPLTSVEPLLALLQLRHVDLTETAITECRDLQQMEQNLKGLEYTLEKPPACH